MAQAAYKVAQEMLQHERNICLGSEATRHFLDLLDNAPLPNAMLKSAVAEYKNSDLHAGRRKTFRGT